MVQQLSHEVEVKVSAAEAWELYGTLRLAKLIGKEFSNVFEKIEVIEGDGGAGTVLRITYAPGALGFTGLIEKFTTIDNEKRLKVAEVIKGGFLDLGFTLYRIIYEVIEKGDDSCITKVTIEYDVKEEAAANASYVKIERSIRITEIANNYLIKNKASKDVHLA